MKKLLSAIVSLSLLMNSSLGFSADAVDVAKYKPSFYMRYNEYYNLMPYKTNRFYINRDPDPKYRSNLAFDPAKEIRINVGMYYEDESVQTNDIRAKVKVSSPALRIESFADAVAKYDTSSYSDFTSSGQIITEHNTEENTMLVSYPAKPDKSAFELKTLYSDSYPLACFDIIVDPDIDYGVHTVKYVTVSEDAEEYTYSSLSGYDPVKLSKASDTQTFSIVVSDRELGDVNKDNKFTLGDAAVILTACSNLANKKPSGLSDAQFLSADVNSDAKITTADAALILNYCAYLSKYLPPKATDESFGKEIVSTYHKDKMQNKDGTLTDVYKAYMELFFFFDLANKK